MPPPIPELCLVTTCGREEPGRVGHESHGIETLWRCQQPALACLIHTKVEWVALPSFDEAERAGLIRLQAELDEAVRLIRRVFKVTPSGTLTIDIEGEVENIRKFLEVKT